MLLLAQLVAEPAAQARGIFGARRGDDASPERVGRAQVLVVRLRRVNRAHHAEVQHVLAMLVLLALLPRVQLLRFLEALGAHRRRQALHALDIRLRSLRDDFRYGWLILKETNIDRV